MGLETGTYINSLVATNPVGATDPKSQGDDHLRLIKSTLLNTFPSITGAVTLTHTQINDAAQKSVSNTFTGGNQATNVGAGSVSWTASANDVAVTLTANKTSNTGSVGTTSGHDFAILTGGVSRVLVTGAGAVLINGVDATDFARLSQNNVFTGAVQKITNAGGAPQWALVDNSVQVKLQADSGGSQAYCGTVTNFPFSLITNNAIRLTLDAAGTLGGSSICGVAFSDFARLSQANVFTGGGQQLTGGGTEKLRLTAASGTNVSVYQAWFRTNNSTRRGYFGFGSDGDNTLSLVNEETTTNPNISISASSGIVSITGASIQVNSVNVTDFARLSQANVFTAVQTIQKSGLTTLTINDSGGATGAYVAYGMSGTAQSWTGTAAGLISGGATTDFAAVARAGSFIFSGDNGTTQHLKLSASGLVTTPGASASEVGRDGLPQNSQSVSYTAVLADRNGNLHQTGASKTFTIPANGSVAYPIGTTLVFSTDNATGVSIAITTDTLRLAGTATTGTRTLAQYGVATAVKILSTTWLISGAGLS